MPTLYRADDAPAPEVGYVVRRAAAPAAALLAGDASAWSEAHVIHWGPPAYRTAFQACWDDEMLACRFEARDDGAWHTMRRRDARLWEEEVVEIFLDPAGRGADYAEIEISPANVVCDLIVRRPWPSLESDPAWHLDGLQTAVVPWIAGGAVAGWVATAILPWRGLRSLSAEAARAVPPRAGDVWRFNVCRIKRPGGPAAPERDAIYAAWSVPDAPSFHVPAAFRPFHFAPAGAVGTGRAGEHHA
jgi:hypothetical protein